MKLAELIPTHQRSRRRLLYVILAASLFFVLGAHAESQNTTIIGLGESVRIDVPLTSKIHISDGGVVRARAIGNSMVLTGKRTGRTSLRFLPDSKARRPQATEASDVDQVVYVTERKVAEAARRFEDYLRFKRGLRFDVSALPQLVVNGELLRIDDWRNLSLIAKTYQLAWRLEANVFPPLRRRLHQTIDMELKKLAWPGDLLRVDENGIKLTSGAEGPKHSAPQLLAVTTLGLQLESSSTLNELEPMVRTQIVLAEVRKTKSQRLGIGWPQNTFVNIAESFVVTSEKLIANIQALENSGDARILAMPNLLCRSGGEAKFFAGGEIPIKVSTIRTAQVEWKKYGISLHVQPRADRLGRLKFQLSTEVSSLDHTDKPDGIPGLSTNRIDTQFNLKGTETVVLSGLIKKDESKTIVGLGLLNSIPILGRLFESHDYQNRLTELLVFVTPEVYFPNSSFGDGDENDFN